MSRLEFIRAMRERQLDDPAAVAARASGGSQLKVALSGIPDFLTAACFLAGWVAPQLVGLGFVRSLVVAMIFEFFAVHSSGILFGISNEPERSRRFLVPVLVLLAVAYFAFAGLLATAFDAPGAFVLFAVMLLSKMAVLFVRRGTYKPYVNGALVWTHPMATLVAMTALCYIAGVGIAVILPVPALGIDAETVAAMGLPGSGAFVDTPHKALAAGVIYFIGAAFTRMGVTMRWG